MSFFPLKKSLLKTKNVSQKVPSLHPKKSLFSAQKNSHSSHFLPVKKSPNVPNVPFFHPKSPSFHPKSPSFHQKMSPLPTQKSPLVPLKKLPFFLPATKVSNVSIVPYFHSKIPNLCQNVPKTPNPPFFPDICCLFTLIYRLFPVICRLFLLIYRLFTLIYRLFTLICRLFLLIYRLLLLIYPLFLLICCLCLPIYRICLAYF
jgi:hypothetical protein